jgi:hypothetical protein
VDIDPVVDDAVAEGVKAVAAVLQLHEWSEFKGVYKVFLQVDVRLQQGVEEVEVGGSDK